MVSFFDEHQEENEFLKNVVFIINSIGSGGAESALFNVIEGIPSTLSSQVNIHLILLDDEPQLKQVPTGICLHVLNSKRSLLRSVWLTYRLVKKLSPHIVVSFLVRANMVNSILRVCRLYAASVVCERMHLSSHLKFQVSGIKALVANLLPKILYRNNDLVLGVSSGVTNDLVQHYGVPKTLCKTIYNPYNVAALMHNAAQPLTQKIDLPERFIVSVGRLTKSKDQVCLIKGFAKANTALSLVIVGMGDELEALRQLAKNEGVGDKVYFTGYLNNPHYVINKALFFISCSRNEGFPNALLESMVLAKPIIFTSCDSGPAEILGEAHNFKAQKVTHAKYGILIPEGSILDVAKAIEQMLAPAQLKKYQVQSSRRAKDFTLHKIAAEYWFEIFRLLSERKRV